MNNLLTQRQLERLGRLPPDYKIVAAQKGSPVVRRPDGERLLVQPNGSLAVVALVERVQSYLPVDGGRAAGPAVSRTVSGQVG